MKHVISLDKEDVGKNVLCKKASHTPTSRKRCNEQITNEDEPIKRKKTHQNVTIEKKSEDIKNFGELKYIKACGVKRNSECIYIPKQKLMYVKNSVNKYGQQTYICYNYKSQKCCARVVAINSHTCVPSAQTKQHTCIGDHKQFRYNCKLLKNIKNRALEVKRTVGTQTFSVSMRVLFDEEKSK